jgi:dTDP-4-amino-4,6-dideoxygalactose transaminase
VTWKPQQWKVLLSPPEVGEHEREMLLAAFDSGWVAPAGPDIAAFEEELAELTGVGAVAALSSGTAAMHLALMAVGVQRGDEVLVSDLTFGASAFAVDYLGARPVFVDCEPATWHIDPDLLDAELAQRAHDGRLPAAVVAVDLYGSVADGARIAATCARFGVPLVEDAAEALGARRGDGSAGRYGKVAVLSFNGNKMVTTGGGGALISDDGDLVAHARHLATQARQPEPWYEHREIGFNYRMGNLNAAVGRGQLRTLPERIAGRRRVHQSYQRHLGALPGVTFQGIPEQCLPNFWLTTVSFDPVAFGATPTQILSRLRDEGIEARHGFKPMHLQPVFAGCDMIGGAVSEHLFATSVSLPSGSRLTEADVQWICDVVASARG